MAAAVGGKAITGHDGSVFAAAPTLSFIQNVFGWPGRDSRCLLPVDYGGRLPPRPRAALWCVTKRAHLAFKQPPLS
ncbi:hypothetical protein Atai01_00510 [Amycolatopsis taiwanensis]|uniref:Uncharacterized protein n=1 Tax=Amycolatopsis taiwanensis TaxID=342230 RepID=A0A9W6QWQ7_9PSEU|nr:hypothetical protein Atai01_00510 [Amycolatopsis taiwanensis]